MGVVSGNASPWKIASGRLSQLRRRRARPFTCTLLLASIAILAAACGGGSNSSSADTGSETAEGVAASPDQETPPDWAAETAEPPPEVAVQLGPGDSTAELEGPLLIYVVPHEVPQGHAFLVAVDAPGAGFASVAYGGQIFTLLREGDRLFAILAVEALAPPGPAPLVISVADTEGRQTFRHETIVSVIDSAWGTEVVQLDENNQALLDPDVIGEDVKIREMVQRGLTPERHWSGLFDQPATGVITSNFGLLRSYNFQQPTEYHSGLDFAGDNGDPVLAPNAGVVAWVGRTQRRGNSLIIDHGGGVYSGYYHLSEVLVTEDTVVTTGDPLGRIGATGLATGPHLHWEIVVHGIAVNPVQWIRDQEIPDPGAELDPALAISVTQPEVGVGG
jgi:murein DD-endopeptidase MepM/ murein hydrolase activator NlpD